MAQHISLFENKYHQEIKESIIKSFSKKNYVLGSFKYEELNDKNFKISENDKVFINRRKIKENEEIFEIHFDFVNNKILEIFWVK